MQVNFYHRDTETQRLPREKEKRQRGSSLWILSVIPLCFCVFVVMMFAALSAKAELRGGAAKVDMTPDVKASAVPLGGYAARKGARATGVHDPVYARALTLSDGKTTAVVVSLDLCFVPASIKTEVVKCLKASGNTNVDAAHLFLAATHTHTAPDPLAMHTGNTFTHLNGWTPFDQKLLDFTADKIAQAVMQAGKDMVPVRISASVQNAAGANRNRRNDPTVDPAFTTLKVTQIADGKTLVAVVNFAAHPTLYDDKMLDISADWPGVMTSDVESAGEKGEAGGAKVCLFLNGAEGDASPNGVDDVQPDAKVSTYGHRMGKRAMEQLAVVSIQTDAPFGMWTQSVTLPPRKPNALFFLAAAQMGATMTQAKDLVNTLMPTSTEIDFIRLGDLLLMGFPCEPTGDIGMAAKTLARQSGYKVPAVVALVNDWLAYCLTPAQYKAGKYEAVMSFYGDQFGPTLLAGVKNGLLVHKKF